MANVGSDDEIMEEAVALAQATDSEQSALEKACEEEEGDIKALRERLTRLRATRTASQLEYDATLVSVALTDSEAFLAQMLNTSAKQREELKHHFGEIMERSVDHFVRQMDAMSLRAYFVPTEGSTHPNLTFALSEDKRTFRVQRWMGLDAEKKLLHWEIHFGPRNALEDAGYTRRSPALLWLADVTEWGAVIGNAPNAPLPPFPCVPDPLEQSPEKAGPTPSVNAQPEPESKKPTAKAVKRGIEDDPRVPALLKLIKSDRVPSPESRLPRPGSAFFDYTDSFPSRPRTVLRPSMFEGKRTVLVLGTSYTAHWRIAEEGFGCFVDLGTAEPRNLQYPQYDMTHLWCDDPNTVVLQFAGSGWHLKYGPHPRDAKTIYKFVTEEVFEFQEGFRPDYLMLQIGTNDLKFCTAANVPENLRPKTDLQFVVEMQDEARDLAEEFKPRVGTVLLGMGLPKYRHRPDQLMKEHAFEAEMRPEALHKVLHRVTYLYEGVAAKDALRARKNLKNKLVHSPMPMLPMEAAVRIAHHIGHIQAPWYGVAAKNAVNSIRNGIRMLDRDYECSLLLCCGSPRLFGPDLVTTQDGIHPKEAHSHNGHDRCRQGVELVCSARDSNAQDAGFWYSLVDIKDRGDLSWTVW